MLFNDFVSICLIFSYIFFKLAVPNLFNLLIMKNVKRIVLLIALIFFASKVLSPDFELFKSEDNATAIVKK